MTWKAILREARHSAGLSQRELARRAGTSQPALAAYESGRKVPSVETYARLLAAAGRRLSCERAAPGSAVDPGSARLARSADALLEVIDLAAALPTRHEPRSRYPRLPS